MEADGRCLGCSMIIRDVDSVEHIRSCEKINSSLNNDKAKQTECYFVKVYSEDYPHTYWMNLVVPHQTTLKELEDFILDTWLDCCGHMKVWGGVKGKKHIHDTDEDDEESISEKIKKKPIKELVKIDQTISLEYDMGTTTAVAFHFLSNINYSMNKPSIKVLARNVPPKIGCQNCGASREAEVIHYGVPKCKQCCRGIDREQVLLVCNSPRSGQCGYEGPDKISSCYLLNSN